MKKKVLFLSLAAISALALLPSASAQTRYRRAYPISASNPNEGRCTVSVMVDRSTDVEIRGDMATLRNNYGVPARFERFECTGALPALPSDLRIRAVEGAGRITLTHDSDNAGVAVIHVRNSEGDSQMYTFDVYWDNNARRSQSGFAERSSDDEAVESCRNAVENRVRRDGYRGVQFGNIAVDERGPSDFVTGTASARLGYRDEGFSFTCRVTPDGNVRALDVTRH